MALKSRTWACPDCDGQFTTIMDDREGPPKFCQLCGSDMSADSEPVPNFSRISKPQNQTMDKVYRGMEAASYARAEEAASMLNVPVSEVSNIRMTDMKDNLREGDISAKIPTPTMAPSQPPPNLMGGSQGLATAAMIKSQGGSVGQSVMDGFRQSHHQRASQMMRMGEMGRVKAEG